MAEILTMPGVASPDATADRQPVADLIETLECLLKEAKSGDLRAMAVATVRLGGVTGTLWERPENGDTCGHSLMAAVSYLQHRYAGSMSADAKSHEMNDNGPESA